MNDKNFCTVTCQKSKPLLIPTSYPFGKANIYPVSLIVLFSFKKGEAFAYTDKLPVRKSEQLSGSFIVLFFPRHNQNRGKHSDDHCHNHDNDNHAYA